jgi:hypothetical protein
MVYIEDVSYSHDDTITAIKSYHSFLVSLYLPPSAIIHPPPTGWPSITSASMSGLGKTETVVELLKHLPYIAVPPDDSFRTQGAPHAVFADWQRTATLHPGAAASILRAVSEGSRRTAHVPGSVVGLTAGGRENRMLLLDTDHGVVYWPDCPSDDNDQGMEGEVFAPLREEERLEDDPYDWCGSDEEAMWREEGGAWPVKEFFEMWMDEFRALRFVPVGKRVVKDVYTRYHPSQDGLLQLLRGVYRDHGWPDLERYRKEECLVAVQAALREHYPDLAEVDEDEG